MILMRPQYERPRVQNGDLRTPVKFYSYKANTGPEPGEAVEKLEYMTWAKVDEVWSKDVAQAKSNNTLSDITISIRDTQGEYIPSNKHYIEVDLPEYKDKHYNIKHVQPDPQNRDFIKVIAGMVDA